MGAAELWIEDDVGNYDPGTGRFLQKDPEPGKLAIPGTVVNSYAYCLNNPLMYTDPSGKFIPLLVAAIIGVAVLAAGTYGGYLNYKDAKANGATSGQAALSFALGFITASAATALSIAFPPLAIPFAFAGGFINNLGNQFIFHPDDISLSRALVAGGVSGAFAYLGGQLASGLNDKLILPAFSRVGEALGSGVGTAGGYCIDTGVSNSWSYSCGIEINTPASSSSVPASP